MKKILTFMTLVAAFTCQVVNAQDVFTTKGNGTTYSINTLKEIAEAGIEILPDEDTSQAPPSFWLHKSITIVEGDRFEMDEGVVVYFDKDVKLTIEGVGDFRVKGNYSSLLRLQNISEASTASVRIKSQTTTEMRHCNFYGMGVEVTGEGAVNMQGCQFSSHNGSTAAALYFITAGEHSIIDDCKFIECEKAAIGSAANASRPMTIKNCLFSENSKANNNIPQINITAAKPLIIDSSSVYGHPEHTMVGGIGISNFMSYDADITISNNYIEMNRYGIGIVGPAAKIRIEGNNLIDNCYETDPMNGGSGISLYDPYMKTCAVISNNHIEGSLWGVTVIGCKDVNLGCLDEGENYNPGGNVFKDNGNNGQLYDLYNNSTITVYAQGNTWNVSEQTEEQIETVIFHKNDNPALGQVIYMPAANTTSIKDIHTNVQNTAFYDLQGRKTKASFKGIYIVNGKKVVR